VVVWTRGSMASSASRSGRDGRHDDHAGAVRFLQQFVAMSAKRRLSVAAAAPIGQIQLAALHHPDPFVRRGCLGFLDHYANEASASVFALALRDPVELVRHAALHSLGRRPRPGRPGTRGRTPRAHRSARAQPQGVPAPSKAQAHASLTPPRPPTWPRLPGAGRRRIRVSIDAVPTLPSPL
jgi:hypothetical protein